MIAAPLHFNGVPLMLDPAGALACPEEGWIAVADLHLEKGSAAAAGGRLVPPWDSQVTLDLLVRLIRRWQPRLVIALGDSFHDGGGRSRLTSGDAARLRAITGARRFIWIAGNHDPVPDTELGGECVGELTAGPLIFRHAAMEGARSGEISGHYHPKARITTRAGAVTRPCFAADSHRLILPALGAYAGGLDVSSPAFAPLFPQGGRAFALGRDRLYSFRFSRAPASRPGSNRPQSASVVKVRE